MLHYCNRAYNRQFSKIAKSGENLLVKLSRLINDYFENGEQFAKGVPSIQYFADKLCMSPNYFSDLLKKSTGETASNFIRRQIVRMAKNRLAATGNVSQVAYDLGFEDLEGLQTMRNLGRNIVFMIKALVTQKAAEGLPKQELNAFTSFGD